MLALTLTLLLYSPETPDVVTAGEPETAPELAPKSGARASEPSDAADDAERTGDATEPDPLTTDVFEEPFVPPDILRHVLSLPEYALELAFTPLGLLVYATERYALHKRIPDLLKNESGTIRVSPEFRFSFGQGFGGGATLSFQSLTRDEGIIAIGALARVNQDRAVYLTTQRRFSVIEGRRLALSGSYEIDRDREFYGIGNDSTFDDRRTVRDQTTRITTMLDITPRGATTVVSTARFEYLRQTLLPGEGPRAPPVGSDPDVAPPPGFQQNLDFIALGAHLALSSIDSSGKPTRGGLIELDGRALTDVDGDAFSAGYLELRMVHYLEVLPRNRVFAFKAGANAAFPLREGDQVPFDQLVSYGGSSILRGYRRGRFRDELGWWGAIEYSFPVYDLGGLGLELAPTFFVDVGRVGNELDSLFEGPLRYAGGVGVRASHDLLYAFSFTLGFSPDGAQFNLSLGETFF